MKRANQASADWGVEQNYLFQKQHGTMGVYTENGRRNKVGTVRKHITSLKQPPPDTSPKMQSLMNVSKS